MPTDFTFQVIHCFIQQKQFQFLHLNLFTSKLRSEATMWPSSGEQERDFAGEVLKIEN